MVYITYVWFLESSSGVQGRAYKVTGLISLSQASCHMYVYVSTCAVCMGQSYPCARTTSTVCIVYFDAVRLQLHMNNSLQAAVIWSIDAARCCCWRLCSHWLHTMCNTYSPLRTRVSHELWCSCILVFINLTCRTEMVNRLQQGL